jgi:uncharacterized membrane protein YuzA (DUF378 family)
MLSDLFKDLQEKNGMKCLKTLALALVIIGAINWGLWGFFQFDLVAWVFGGNTKGLSRLVYCLVGLSGLYSIRMWCHCAGMCKCSSGKGKGGSCCK